MTLGQNRKFWRREQGDLPRPGTGACLWNV